MYLVSPSRHTPLSKTVRQKTSYACDTIELNLPGRRAFVAHLKQVLVNNEKLMKSRKRAIYISRKQNTDIETIKEAPCVDERRWIERECGLLAM